MWIRFSRSEPVLPAEGERGWLEVEVIYLGVESCDVGFAYMPDADDVLEIESGIKPTFSIQSFLLYRRRRFLHFHYNGLLLQF